MMEFFMKNLFYNCLLSNMFNRVLFLFVFSILCITVVMSGCSQKDNDESRIKEETIVATTKEIESTAPFATDFATEEATTIPPTTEVVTEKIIETESHTENTLEKYLGTWSDVDNNGQGFTVTIVSINGDIIECYMCKTAPNAAHIAMTEKIFGQLVEDNKVYFDFTDSFMNVGNGILTLNDDTIYINATVTEFDQPYLYALMGEGELVKISDSTEVPYL